ncbi:MAG: prephenate dehydratase [Clostridiales bacterium]|nr:prephenate dehydratase [Clostridiales bacterium]
MAVSIAYLGPEGTFSEEAAQKFLRVTALTGNIIPYPTIEACTEAVEDGVADFAVIPLENSLEGSVSITLDILTTSVELRICAEIILDIEHNLLVPAGGLAEINKVYSHPQALAQCRTFLRRNLPDVQTVPVFSTAEAAATAAGAGIGSAAISSKRAAGRYHLKILAAAVQDGVNRTRFCVLTKAATAFATAEKTSLLFAVKNAAGSLFRVLQAFAAHNVNLTRIESRPAKSQLGDYIFFVDIDGTTENINVKNALREAGGEAVMLKLLGTYPVLH